jgi:hypothetical protein
LLRPASRRLLVLLTIALAVPASAAAQEPVTTIDGNPLKVFTTPNGRVQVNVDGRDANEFFPSSSQSANAGLGVVLNPTGSSQRFGIGGGGMPAPTVGPMLFPGTTDEDADVVLTTWELGDNQVRVTQVLSYRNGERQFDSIFVLENLTGGPLQLRAFVAGDLTIRGSDVGVGLFQEASATSGRFVGGLNQDVGGTGGFVEQTPWSHYQSGSLSSVFAAASSPNGFDDTVSPELTDNAAGVQWDFVLPSEGSSVSLATAWRFVNTLGITPTTATQTTGDAQTLSVQLADTRGNPAGEGREVVWSVTGANSTSGSTTKETGENGRSEFTYVGGNPGEDAVNAFVDQNSDGNHDSNEPQAVANVTWTGPDAPVLGESANARPLKGTVKIKLPAGGATAVNRAAAKRLGVPLSQAQSGFTKLTENTQIPLGSTLDTSKGTVRILAASLGTKQTGRTLFSSGSFRGGQFVLRQRGRKGLSEMTMRGGGLNSCNSRLPKGGARKEAVSSARKRGRKLFGNARGRFRTRGRNSSATVRGTQWLQRDTCKGTLTKVTSGSVLVRDFTKRRNKVVKKGQRYLARSPKGKLGRRG